MKNHEPLTDERLRNIKEIATLLHDITQVVSPDHTTKGAIAITELLAELELAEPEFTKNLFSSEKGC